jgi:hypothetical protein
VDGLLEFEVLDHLSVGVGNAIGKINLIFIFVILNKIVTVYSKDMA